jgi:hypothetical protein
MSNACLIGKPKAQKQLGRPRRRSVHNSRMDLKEIGSKL